MSDETGAIVGNGEFCRELIAACKADGRYQTSKENELLYGLSAASDYITQIEQRVKELEADYRALEECQERNDASATNIIAEQSSHIVELITVIDNALYTLESNPTPHISRMESAKLILRQAKGHQGRRRNEQI